MADVVLYRWRPEWSLPSLSLGCIQVEAYLRLAKVKFAVNDCTAASSSPTGQVPALDTAEDLVGVEATNSPFTDLAAAKSLIGYLKRKVENLDRGLSTTQRAELVAFSTLIETKLQPALEYTTWCESDAYTKYTRPAYGGAMAFPLSYILPRSQRKTVAKAFVGADPATLYAEAAEALDALSNRLSANTAGGGYFFGQQKSSLDALLFGCLVYLKAAPVVHPQLRAKFTTHRPLAAYVDRILSEYFSVDVPLASEINIQWTKWSGSSTATQDERYNKQKNEKESELNKKGRRWLFGAVLFMGSYILFSGHYPEFSMMFLGDLGEEDDGDEEQE